MGIHRFLAFLKNTFPELVDKLFKLPNNSYTEGLYVDLNSPIHTIAQRLFKYGLDRTLTREDLEIQEMFRRMAPEERQIILFRCIGAFLHYANLRIQPRKMFMLAVDGVAPKAKMIQQRLRRFKSGKPPLDFFDPVVISPGTKFMDDLDKYLTGEWIMTYRDTFAEGLNLLYSSHREPGEGEHKIFEQMNMDLRGSDRTRVTTEYRTKKSAYQVVLGADSDLIVLSLTKNNNIIFMRDALKDWTVKDETAKDMLEVALHATIRCPTDADRENSLRVAMHNSWAGVFNEGFEYIDVAKMRKRILDLFMAPNDVVDFTFLSLFVGNDFLPSVPELEVTVAKSYVYRTDDDIVLKYKAIHDWASKQPVPPPKPGSKLKLENLSKKKVAPFNTNGFWETFRNKERTWLFGDGTNRINYATAQGILNRHSDQYEMYPLMPEPITGQLKRVLLVKRRGDKKWVFVKEDVGTLSRTLMIYRQLMISIRGRMKGQGNTYLVERRNRINYLNLLQFLEELSTYSFQLMESNAANYESMERMGKDPNPLVKQALGTEEITKKNRVPALVPAAFTGLHKIMSFGIYDSKYADKKLPKQAVDEMCRKWLEGAQWTLKYYSEGLRSINTEWFYPYLHSPSISDMISYLRERVIAEVPGYPGIQFSLTDDTVKVEQINIAGSLGLVSRPDPEDPTNPDVMIYDRVFNRSLSGVIYVYTDLDGKRVAQYRTSGGDEKYIDLGKIHFTSLSNQMLQGGSAPDIPVESMSFDYDRIDPSKMTLVEVSRKTLQLQVNKSFVLDDEINNVISDVSRPYASVVESFFTIMPERVLKLILSPYMVDSVINQISDYFPETFEVITEGKFYESASIPKIPFPSSVRVRRALDSIPHEFDREISSFNGVRKREKIIRRGRHGVPEIQDVKIQTIGQTAQGYAASNIASHSRKRQDIEPLAPTAITQYVTGGIGDGMGGVLPQYLEYYKTMFKDAIPPVEEIISIDKEVYAEKFLNEVEMAERNKFKGYNFVFESKWHMPSELPINYQILPSTLKYRPIDLETAPRYSGQRKLLINEILFLTKYGDLSKKVVYVGAAPGHHIAIVAKMFPNHEFHLWDPEKFAIPAKLTKAGNQNANITIFNAPFTNTDALNYRGQSVLLISDLRNLSTGVNRAAMNPKLRAVQEIKDELNIVQDNLLQQRIVAIMEPASAMLKFRLPYVLPEGMNDYWYSDGDIWLQPWSKHQSGEVRLILDSRKFRTLKKTPESMAAFFELPMSAIEGDSIRVPEGRKYTLTEFENKMFYYNAIVRPGAAVTNPLGITDADLEHFKPTFEFAYEIYVWDQWLLGRFGNTSTPDQRRGAVITIMNAVSLYIGKDLSHNLLARDKRTKDFTLSFL